jgi:hypothetical protein
MANDTRLHGKMATVAEAQAFHVSRLGGKCVCCGDTTMAFLEVAFVEYDVPGRLDAFEAPGIFYAYLDKHPDAQVHVLCANCNHARRRHGGCPDHPAVVADAAAQKPGKVTATRTVWCVNCPMSYTAPAHASAQKAELSWMGLGWCRFRGKWYCPACAIAYQGISS